MMTNKYALIIGNYTHTEPRLMDLQAPETDVTSLAAVLQNPAIGGFDLVNKLINPTLREAQLQIGALFAQKKPDDTVLLYFSGHGVLDINGKLYLAVQDTIIGERLEENKLFATGLPTNFITEAIDRCLSKRVILVLDCCNSGSFEKGRKSPIGGSAGYQKAFEGNGYGRIVLTASDQLQNAWETKREGLEKSVSLFTFHLVKGLDSGEADLDHDGWISVDELYQYIYIQLGSETKEQIPHRWNYNQEAELIIAKNPFFDPEDHNYLEIYQKGKTQMAIKTNDKIVTIGRAPDRDLKLQDSQISWEHGEILLETNRYVYRHLSKTNPATIIRPNGAFLCRAGKKEEVVLENGDLLLIGPETLEIRLNVRQAAISYKPTDPQPGSNPS